MTKSEKRGKSIINAAEIRRRAYEIWEAEEKPVGTGHEHCGEEKSRTEYRSRHKLYTLRER